MSSLEAIVNDFILKYPTYHIFHAPRISTDFQFQHYYPQGDNVYWLSYAPTEAGLGYEFTYVPEDDRYVIAVDQRIPTMNFLFHLLIKMKGNVPHDATVIQEASGAPSMHEYLLCNNSVTGGTCYGETVHYDYHCECTDKKCACGNRFCGCCVEAGVLPDRCHYCQTIPEKINPVAHKINFQCTKCKKKDWVNSQYVNKYKQRQWMCTTCFYSKQGPPKHRNNLWLDSEVQ